MEQLILEDHIAIEAKSSEERMNQFVAESKGFILRCASRTCRRFITESDEEYEVAMVAFWEAIRHYDENSGNFASFASLVIRRRLMDSFDNQTRHRPEIPVGHSMTWDEAADENQAGGVMAEVQQAIVRETRDDAAVIREEIEALGSVLRGYGFSFFDLAEASPKADKTKKCCARAVNWMLAVVERILQMRRSHSLPVNAISRALDIARKILERHRRYIIAAIEILDGDYPQLAEYLDYIRKEQVI